ncbi:MAG: lysophospholipid acyltransferase family protein [Chloroflexota bacterium]
MKAILVALSRWEVHGREHVPRHGSLIVVANHIHVIDPPVLSASIPRRVTFMAKVELYRPLFSGLFMRAIGAFPVYRGMLDRRALRRAMGALAHGDALGIFPEGRRSRDGRLQQAQRGAALIALRSGAPIVPVGISGTENVRGILGLLRRPRLVVNIGHPFYLPAIEGKNGTSALDFYIEHIMVRIAALLPESYRGVYQTDERGQAAVRLRAN